MPRKPNTAIKTTALVPTASPEQPSVIVHAPPVNPSITNLGNPQRSLMQSILRFGSSMLTHQRMVLSGSALAGLIGLAFSIAEKNMSSRVAIGLSVVFVAIAVFNAWREEYNKRLDAEEALAVAGKTIHALEYPDIKIKTNSLRVTNSSGHAGQWTWTVELSVQVIPPQMRYVTFADSCEATLTESSSKRDAIYFRFTEFIPTMGIPVSPLDITNAMTIICRAHTTTAPCPVKPGSQLDVIVTLADARTNWKMDVAIPVRADPNQERFWIGA